MLFARFLLKVWTVAFILLRPRLLTLATTRTGDVDLTRRRSPFDKQFTLRVLVFGLWVIAGAGVLFSIFFVISYVPFVPPFPVPRTLSNQTGSQLTYLTSVRYLSESSFNLPAVSPRPSSSDPSAFVLLIFPVVLVPPQPDVSSPPSFDDPHRTSSSSSTSSTLKTLRNRGPFLKHPFHPAVSPSSKNALIVHLSVKLRRNIVVWRRRTLWR